MDTWLVETGTPPAPRGLVSPGDGGALAEDEEQPNDTSEHPAAKERRRHNITN
jgi:hypothetical protein